MSNGPTSQTLMYVYLSVNTYIHFTKRRKMTLFIINEIILSQNRNIKDSKKKY